MAIEPVSSMMTLQAQQISPVRPVPPVTAKPEEFTSAEAADPAAKLDDATTVVESAQEKGNSSEEEGQQRQPSSGEQIRKAVEKLSKSQMEQSEAVFGIHEGTNRVTIKIVDKQTKKTIKELPPEKTLDMIAKVWEMAGLLVDEKR